LERAARNARSRTRGARLALLLKACETHDIVEQLEAIVDKEGAVVTSPQGSKAHPALVEARQQRLTFARLIAALRIPDDDTGTRKQSRSIRGIYQVGA
jgi:hypothetical protein